MADCITVSDFRARFPEFDDTTYPDSQVEALIEDTCCMFDIDRWDCNYSRGHSLYIAHLLYVRTAQTGGNAGASVLAGKQAKTVDGVSVTYAVNAPDNNNDAFFAGTSYGREYLMMRSMVGIGAVCCGSS